MAAQVHTLLGGLHHAHELLQQIFLSVPEEDAYQSWHPALPSLAWHFGRCVYSELHLVGRFDHYSADLAKRVAHLFGDVSQLPQSEQGALPPREHLLNWALESFDRHLTMLANPQTLPKVPDLDLVWLLAWLQQHHAEQYERMLTVLQARALCDQFDYPVAQSLQAQMPVPDMVTVNQGHYRIGAKDALVFDRELPAQSVELHQFRIARTPVSNQDFFTFMHDSGASPPHHWQANAQGQWFEVALNGPVALVADQPVAGISLAQASAYANWLATHNGFTGAVVQHEYQWEVSARMGLLEQTGRVWEWCANTPLAYAGYTAPLDPALRSQGLDQADCAVLRGASLHTQPALRRASYRQLVNNQADYLFSGVRLVLPPIDSQRLQ
jgi:iron(II)-dependent oxidoreductase